MMAKTGLAALTVSLLLVACATPAPEEAAAVTEKSDLPVLLRDRSPVRMEALVSGTLIRSGECLYLDGEGYRALILWGDENVQVARLDGDSWLVNNYTTSVRLREGDMIRGGGGFLPQDGDLSRWTDDAVPASCTGQAVQMYEVRRYDPSTPDGAPPPPPPPPPAPSRSRLLDDAFAYKPSGYVGPRTLIPKTADALEAMFAFVLSDYSANDGPHKCLVGADDALRTRLEAKHGTLYPTNACAWNEGGVVLERNGEKAHFIHAQVDCSRTSELGFCAGMGGATYGNLGAHANGYRLRRKGDGWEIEAIGIGVIS